MNVNFVAVLIASLIPMALGFIWYNPKVFGKVWQHECGLSDEKLKQGKMLLIFGLSFVFSLLFSFALQFMVIHQYHITSAFFGLPITDATTPEGILYKSVVDLVGTSYRTFKHGALHGTIGGFMIALPILSTNALFERKSFKYIAINAGYWIICMGIMGGILSAMM